MSDTTGKLVVHHLNDSRSQRVLWLLEELEVPYEIKKYQRTPEMYAPIELKLVNPLGNAPVITDGRVTVAESGAVIEYIISKYGNGKAQPLESGVIDNLYYTHYAEGSLMPVLVNKLIFTLIPQRAPFLLRPFLWLIFSSLTTKMVLPRLKLHSELLESHLSKTTGFIAGGETPTSADYMMSFALEAWASWDPAGLGPHTKAYIKRIQARPAYKRALEKGGEYKYAHLPF